MAAETGEAFVQQAKDRLSQLESFMSSIVMPDDGRPDRGVVPSIMAIETGLRKILPAGNVGGLDSWVDGKIKTAIAVMQLVSKTQGGRKPY